MGGGGGKLCTLSHLLKVSGMPAMGPKPGYHGTKARLPV